MVEDHYRCPGCGKKFVPGDPIETHLDSRMVWHQLCLRAKEESLPLDQAEADKDIAAFEEIEEMITGGSQFVSLVVVDRLVAVRRAVGRLEYLSREGQFSDV